MIRLWLYVAAVPLHAMVIPGVLGIGALAAIALPGDDLTLTRLLTGCAAMITVQVGGGYLVGRTAARR